MNDGILIVEDEPFLQIFWEDVCSMNDITIGGIASTSQEAMDLLDRKTFSGVVLDVNLVGETSEKVAHRLRASSTPVIVSTGSDPEAIPAAYQGFVTIQKPFRIQDMKAALSNIVS